MLRVLPPHLGSHVVVVESATFAVRCHLPRDVLFVTFARFASKLLSARLKNGRSDTARSELRRFGKRRIFPLDVIAAVS